MHGRCFLHFLRSREKTVRPGHYQPSLPSFLLCRHQTPFVRLENIYAPQSRGIEMPSEYQIVAALLAVLLSSCFAMCPVPI